MLNKHASAKVLNDSGASVAAILSVASGRYQIGGHITLGRAADERLQNGPRIIVVYCFRTRGSAGAVADVERHTAWLPQFDLVLP